MTAAIKRSTAGTSVPKKLFVKERHLRLQPPSACWQFCRKHPRITSKTSRKKQNRKKRNRNKNANRALALFRAAQSFERGEPTWLIRLPSNSQTLSPAN